MLTEKTACASGRFSFDKGCRKLLKVVFLTEKFYKRYEKCTEIEQKDYRPYIRIKVVINGVVWAVPLRSNINHEFVIWTDKDNKCGIDVTKAVVVENPTLYISNTQPHIRSNEFKVLKQINEHQVVQKLQQHIKNYKKAKEHPQVPRNKQLLTYSTLQYFEKYI